MRTIGLIIGLLLFTSAAHAQSNCAPRDKVVKGLQEKYGETVQSNGLMNGIVFELWANLETGTWTFVTTRPSGSACLLHSGEGFEAVEEELEPAGLRL